MKRLTLSLFVMLALGSVAFAKTIEKPVKKYEGSVSIGYSYTLHVGVETIHGVRFINEKSDFFIGGIVGGMFGLPLGFHGYAGVMPRFYWGRNKSEAFISLGVMYYNGTPYRGDAYGPNEYTPEKDYAGGIVLLPEVGVGFKLKNGQAIDIALRVHNLFQLYDSYTEYYKSVGMPAGPGLEWIAPSISIGYRF